MQVQSVFWYGYTGPDPPHRFEEMDRVWFGKEISIRKQRVTRFHRYCLPYERWV